MNTRLLLALSGFVIGFVSPTFAQQTVDPKVEQQIRVLAAKYDEAFNRNDATALGALFSEDAVLSGLHGRFKSRQAIENFHSQQVRAYAPVDRDEREQAMLHLVPLAGAGRKVADMDRHVELVSDALQLMLGFELFRDGGGTHGRRLEAQVAPKGDASSRTYG
jgi:hypothetical protein